MKILAVEFSSARRSVAVAVSQGDGLAKVLSSECEVGGKSVKALGLVEAALKQAGLRRQEIERIAVGLGPGSYAGIRGAIALAQGWQLARAVQLVGISSVECLVTQAQAMHVRGKTTFVIDAQRGEFYLASYLVEDSAIHTVEALHIVPETEVAQRLQRGDRMMGPDDLPQFQSAIKELYPEAATLAQLAARRGDFVSGEQLEPIYLRQTQFVKAPPPRFIPE